MGVAPGIVGKILYTYASAGGPALSGGAYWIWQEVSQVANAVRNKICLACTECKQRNYNNMKNKKNTPDRVELKKYCPFCKKHTSHRETK